jgi:hypothetical protein
LQEYLKEKDLLVFGEKKTRQIDTLEYKIRMCDEDIVVRFIDYFKLGHIIY